MKFVNQTYYGGGGGTAYSGLSSEKFRNVDALNNTNSFYNNSSSNPLMTQSTSFNHNGRVGGGYTDGSYHFE